MNKARLLQFLSLFLLILGGIILYMNLTTGEVTPAILAGIGPILTAVALLIISRKVK
jgi:hypothetical protein